MDKLKNKYYPLEAQQEERTEVKQLEVDIGIYFFK